MEISIKVTRSFGKLGEISERLSKHGIGHSYNSKAEIPYVAVSLHGLKADENLPQVMNILRNKK